MIDEDARRLMAAAQDQLTQIQERYLDVETVRKLAIDAYTTLNEARDIVLKSPDSWDQDEFNSCVRRMTAKLYQRGEDAINSKKEDRIPVIVMTLAALKAAGETYRADTVTDLDGNVRNPYPFRGTSSRFENALVNSIQDIVDSSGRVVTEGKCMTSMYRDELIEDLTYAAKISRQVLPHNSGLLEEVAKTANHLGTYLEQQGMLECGMSRANIVCAILEPAVGPDEANFYITKFSNV
jgi:hypothetical protein